MKLRLLDYAGEEHFCEVPNNTKEIVINIVSGDMILIYPVYFDTSDCRNTDYFDGGVLLKKKDFHVLDEITNSYDLFEYSCK